ncbi:hypothetical protein [Tropicimonas aquimaris]|uniref:Dynamin family protein n=1 Tax=Tropicimonas aquimaris TaxID=914152 RepID=A0ABW3IT64_9RHOB
MQTFATSGSARPVVALMGEFSAGKSTLANLLIGEGVSPVRVTATQLPPIWYAHGAPGAECVDHDGGVTELDLDDLGSVSVEDTAYIRIRLESDILELMDLIDMPGISDPNLSSKTWKQVLPYADCVIWCSHSTQAWRQSEAAIWSEVPEHLYDNSILLLTRFDKILTEIDRRRLLARVRSETDGLFSGVFPISLLQAANAEEDRTAWEDSGAEDFTQKLLDVVMGLHPAARDERPRPVVVDDAILVERRTVGSDDLDTEPTEAARAPAFAGGVGMVTPRRVVRRAGASTSRERLPRSALDEVSF